MPLLLTIYREGKTADEGREDFREDKEHVNNEEAQRDRENEAEMRETA